MDQPPGTAEIGHILFLDIVGWSQESMEAQLRLVRELSDLIRNCPTFLKAQETGALRVSPTGDGMFVIFTGDLRQPASCAIELALALQSRPHLSVRAGIHTGPVLQQTDSTGVPTYAGDGVVIAKRIMDMADGGYILLSPTYAGWLRKFEYFAALVHPVGRGPIKHGEVLEVFSLASPNFGRAQPPRYLTQAGFNSAESVPESRPQFPLHGAPPKPARFIGRRADLESLKQILGVNPNNRGTVRSTPRAAAINGWPGVGKSTVVSVFPHDAEIQATYPDGIYWMAFGQLKPQEAQSRLIGKLSQWTQESLTGPTLDRWVEALRDQLRNRRVLMIADDCWETALASTFLRIVGEGSTVLYTSRNPSVAQHLVPAADDRFVLDELALTDGIELLHQLAPQTKEYPEDTAALVETLGGLPLALVVAGGILGGLSAQILGVHELLKELRGGTKILEGPSPAEMIEFCEQTPNPSVTELIRKSTDLLSPEQRLRFAQLSAFAPKPASFKVRSAAVIWDMDTSEAVAELEQMAGLGLVQAMSDGTIQMHALLNLYASILLKQM